MLRASLAERAQLGIFSVFAALFNLLFGEKSSCQNSGHVMFAQDVLSTVLDLHRPVGMAVNSGHMTTSSSGQGT